MYNNYIPNKWSEQGEDDENKNDKNLQLQTQEEESSNSMEFIKGKCDNVHGVWPNDYSKI
jgi:hypothetical protein